MNKSLWVILGVVLVAVVLGAMFFYLKTNNELLDLTTPTSSASPVPNLPQPALDQLKGQPNQIASVSAQIDLLDRAVLELKDQLDQVKAGGSGGASVTESQILTLQKNIADLQQQVTQLKSGGTTTNSSGKSPVLYIPLGVDGQGGNTDWYDVPGYEVDIDPADYPGYKNMQLEVAFRLGAASGTGYARLFNVTDNSDVGISVQTTTDQYGWYTSYFFNVPTSGKKTYHLQLKSSTGTQIYFQMARIRVNF